MINIYLVIVTTFLLVGCNRNAPDLILRLSPDQTKDVRNLLDHPGWLERIEISGALKAAGVVFEIGDRVELNGNLVKVYGSADFQNRVKMFFEKFNEYELFLRDSLETPSEWK